VSDEKLGVFSDAFQWYEGVVEDTGGVDDLKYAAG